MVGSGGGGTGSGGAEGRISERQRMHDGAAPGKEGGDGAEGVGISKYSVRDSRVIGVDWCRVEKGKEFSSNRAWRVM